MVDCGPGCWGSPCPHPGQARDSQPHGHGDCPHTGSEPGAGCLPAPEPSGGAGVWQASNDPSVFTDADTGVCICLHVSVLMAL